MAVQMGSNTLPLVKSPSRGVGCINDLCYRDQAIFLIMKNRQTFQNTWKKKFFYKNGRKSQSKSRFSAEYAMVVECKTCVHSLLLHVPPPHTMHRWHLLWDCAALHNKSWIRSMATMPAQAGKSLHSRAAVIYCCHKPNSRFIVQCSEVP